MFLGVVMKTAFDNKHDKTSKQVPKRCIASQINPHMGMGSNFVSLQFMPFPKEKEDLSVRSVSWPKGKDKDLTTLFYKIWDFGNPGQGSQIEIYFFTDLKEPLGCGIRQKL